MLPTDERYQSLSYSQKALLFDMFMDLPLPEELRGLSDRINYIESQKIQKNDEIKNYMRDKLGLNEEDISQFLDKVNKEIENQVKEEIQDLPLPKLNFMSSEE